MSRKWGYVSFRGLKPLDFAIIVTLNVLIGGYVWQGYIKEIKGIDKSPPAAATPDSAINAQKSEK